jgi:hypothetical protein
MIDAETTNKVKEIKRSFRLMMNGPTSQSMREKGIDYHVNWGVALPLLKEKAKEYGKDYDLAIELWKENVRECKILATLIMPADKMLPEIVDLWMEQTDTQEIAEQAAFNLYQYLDYAPVLAYQWMASDKPIYQLTAYQILSRLFMNGQEPNERGINEFLDQVVVALQGGNAGVKHAAFNCLMRFSDLGESYEIIAKNALKSQGLDII